MGMGCGYSKRIMAITIQKLQRRHRALARIEADVNTALFPDRARAKGRFGMS